MLEMKYEQALKDHDFLWRIDSAYDMTGGYVDQNDLDKLLRSPTKKTAKECLCNQIVYWFDSGVEDRCRTFESIITEYPEVEKIMERHNISRHWRN